MALASQVISHPELSQQIVKSITTSSAISSIPDGATIMFGGFMGVGTPERLMDELVIQNKKKLTVIGNDTARPGVGVGKLISAGLVEKAIVSHIGTNPETQQKMINGDLEVDLIPQGTLAERIRAAGYGLGGVLTPTAVGTIVAEGKQTIEIEGKCSLVEPPLHADIALVKARHADYFGNLEYFLTAQNFNPIMAMAASTVIVEADQIVPVGCISPDSVHTPGVLVDFLVSREVV